MTGVAVLSLSCYHTAFTTLSARGASLPAQSLDAPAMLI